MSNTSNDTMNINIWEHAQHINIPMNGHYNLEPGRSYTLAELADMGNKFGLKCKESLENYTPIPSLINPASSPEKQVSQHLLMACMRMHFIGRCPQCRDEIRTNDLYAYHPNFSDRDRINTITPCSMNKANATPFVYGINVPSGRLVVGNDMRELVYVNAERFGNDTEEKNREKLTTYANTGLLYIYAHGGVSIYATNTQDSYIMGSIPNPEYHDEDEITDFLNKLPNAQRPRDIESAPLAEISCGLWAICAMDGDHVDAALETYHPSDAQNIREDLTTIHVTPGYYQLTLDSVRDVAKGSTAILTRIDDGAKHPIFTATTFSMAEAINALKAAEYYDFHPFRVWNDRVDWALGCPSPDCTNDVGDTYEDIAPITCDIPPLNGLLDIRPNAFNIWAQQQILTDPKKHIFAPFPRNMAPQAIACWIAGADSTMHAIQNYKGGKDFPPFSQHRLANIYRVYEHFRSTLWGLAMARGINGAVLEYIAELRAIIDTNT